MECCCSHSGTPAGGHLALVVDECEQDPINYHVPSSLTSLPNGPVVHVQPNDILPVPPVPPVPLFRMSSAESGAEGSDASFSRWRAGSSQCASSSHTLRSPVSAMRGSSVVPSSSAPPPNEEFTVLPKRSPEESTPSTNTWLSPSSAMPGTSSAASDVSALRGERFVVSLEKGEGEKFGIKLHESRTTTEVFVKHVEAGLFQEWNTAHPHQRVEAGDMLISVNGVSGPKSHSIVEAMKTRGLLELVFLKEACFDTT